MKVICFKWLGLSCYSLVLEILTFTRENIHAVVVDVFLIGQDGPINYSIEFMHPRKSFAIYFIIFFNSLVIHIRKKCYADAYSKKAALLCLFAASG